MSTQAAPDASAAGRDLWSSLPSPDDAGRVAPANRAEMAANLIAELAAEARSDGRLGSKDEVRLRCSVSVGTFNEALKIAQARGVVTLRRGPGGGIFAARQTPLVRLGNQMLVMDDSEHIVADALRMRNVLDPLVIEDALMYSSAADILAMREEVKAMKQAMADGDVPAFLHGNWRFQARVASISPNSMLRTVFLGLLEILERHAVTLRAPEDRPVPGLLEERFELYQRMADAMESRDRDAAMQIMNIHNNTGIQPAASPKNSDAPVTE
ncbi:FadR/GntR family transcriptional regulator [Pseudarthrobacter sp. N5]|uniref:FadR/GntR family transcriptional regulator n=1 Tax=Pseudarthrobacter sp. N5 TaxID=3418416 RepID=UPI003CF99CC0